MNNNVNNPYKNVSAFTSELYDNLSFVDLYSSSLLRFIIITIVVLVIYIYGRISQSKKIIADDWINQRCKPQNMIFAGFITHPEGQTPFEYTSENFQFCVQQILYSISGHALEPFQYMMKVVTDIFSAVGAAIQEIREIMNKIRNSVREIGEDILNRILNIIVPIQTMLIALIDALSKVQGIMTGGLYTMLGTYYTLKSLLGAILELIIKMLIILAIVIVGLWILPFTWPIASTMSVVFLAILIPLAIIVYFMTEVLHIQTSGLPALRCFDKDTEFVLQNKTTRTIQDICVGDILLDGSTITAKIKVLSTGLDMYSLDDIVVSGCHIVKYRQKWIPVREHPHAIHIPRYTEPCLYCLNTSSKTIVLNNNIFTDWDEIYDEDLNFILGYKDIRITENISKTLDVGFNENSKIKLIDGTKLLKTVEIGDILVTGGIVYGIVELDKNLGVTKHSDKLYHLLVSNRCFELDGVKHFDYNNNIDSVLQLRKILSKEYV